MKTDRGEIIKFTAGVLLPHWQNFFGYFEYVKKHASFTL